jgi:serine/threonine protein kinase
VPAAAASGGLPTRLGKYEIVSPLAAGGMARIYIARSSGIGSFERHVVLKLITPERANDSVAVNMFLDEARLAASLNHQNVAQVFEVGEDSGIHYLAMEYVHGQDLRALLAKAGGQGTRVPLDLALTVVAGAAAGLHHAHERRGPDGVPLGIVHRDVSPSNIMIGYDGAVKLLDFGIAKAAMRSVETQAGIIKGKFAYMAPEQCRGRDVDRRSDVFSLGIILYEVTTQHRCFRADSDFDTMHRIVTGDVVRPSRLIQGYPPALEAIVMKALAIDATQRYQSAGLLLEALETYAASARMSLSTMSLGRFMREMFGEQPEPWLTNSGRVSHPAMPKESTISSTNAPGSRLSGRMAAAEPAPGGVQAARTLLDLPRGVGEEHDLELDHEDPNVGEWNAKSYPTAPPTYASSTAIPSGGDVRQSSHIMPVPSPAMLAAAAAAGVAPGSASLAPPSVAPQGTIPPMIAPLAAGRGPAGVTSPGAPGLGHGDLSYPRYEPPSEPSGEVLLKPNRRPYVIGAAAVVVVLAVVIAMTIGGSGGNVGVSGSAAAPSAAPEQNLNAAPVEPTSPPPAQAGSDGSAAAAAAAPGSAAPGAEADQPPIDDEMVSIRVVSEPPGADVLITGMSIGTTPIDVKYKKGTGQAYLTVHRAKYVDVTTLIDLSGDFTKEVTLKKVEESDDEKKRAEDDHKKQDKQLEAKRAEEKRLAEAKRQEDLRKQQEAARRQEELRRQQEARRQEESKKPPEAKKPKDPKCQQPSHYNPFDTSCLGMPGASPTGACPACKDFK